GHALLEDLLRVLDLPAERAREIALEERLEFHQERELVVALDPLLREIARDRDALTEGDAHALTSCGRLPSSPPKYARVPSCCAPSAHSSSSAAARRRLRSALIPAAGVRRSRRS